MYNSIMKNENILTTNYIHNYTSLPIFSEDYSFENSERLGEHSHEFVEIGITTQGCALHHTSHGVFPLKRGSIYFIPIGSSHAISQVQNWHVKNIYLLPKLLFHELSSESFHCSTLQYFLLKHGNSSSAPFHLDLEENTTSIIDALFTAYFGKKMIAGELSDLYEFNCLFNILLLLCDNFYQSHAFREDELDDRIIQITELINDHIYDQSGDIISLISNTLMLHPQQINRIIKKISGSTLSNFIIECKLEKSIRLLLTDAPVTEIAHTLGFYDHSHYNKYFTRYIGISPSAYRKKSQVLLKL